MPSFQNKNLLTNTILDDAMHPLTFEKYVLNYENCDSQLFIQSLTKYIFIISKPPTFLPTA